MFTEIEITQPSPATEFADMLREASNANERAARILRDSFAPSADRSRISGRLREMRDEVEQMRIAAQSMEVAK